MYNLTSSSFSFSNSLAENEKRRHLERSRNDLTALNLKINGVIKTPNGVEWVSDLDYTLGQIVLSSGHRY